MLDTRIPVKGSDELSQLADTINDMSGRLKLLIEEEKQWEKAKNDIVTNLSHDLRTPLTSILGYMDLIGQNKYKDEEDLQHYSGIVYSKCKSLKTLVDDLFDYSKLNSAGLKLNRIRLNLAELLEQVVLGFIPILNENGINYRLLFQAEKVNVNGDPVLLARLFDNLVNNAVNHGKEGKRLDIELQKADGNAVIKIINFGSPILEEELPLIFERFYQSDKSRSRNEEGSGLGLAIVKSIVNLHGGTVGAQSQNGKTVFEVLLPLD
jgi:signal transduction histidine kinase